MEKQNGDQYQAKQQHRRNRDQNVEAMDTHESDFITTDIEDGNGQLSPQMDVAQMDVVSTPSAPQINSKTVGMDATASALETISTEEESRSEATFSFAIENFSKLKDTVLSPSCFVRNLPWKIMAMPRIDRNQSDNVSLGFFLQCNGDSDSQAWSCNAAAELRMKSFRRGQEPFVRKIKHLFYYKENDWGFSYFTSMSDILDPEKGYILNDTIVLEVYVVAEAPHGVYWDSKKLTGYVGLKNQGATCYMNSLLQTLFFTSHLRKSVYKMPTEADDSSKSVALALQRVFHDLQFTDKPVGTKKLTKSFGWETLDSFMQHDVQEFLRVLLDKLETKMKGTCVEGSIPSLFEGKMVSYIKCKNIDYESTRLETFYDIQLNIKGKKNIEESFMDYVRAETLKDDNKYDAGVHGFQEADKGVKFKAFPPVLHLHLMRFQYDPITDTSVKFNDRFEFHEQINLDKYLSENESTPATYKLHAVLVHSGDNHGGHYVVYINPLADGKWCKFDDDVVSSCTKTEAIDHNYGGIDDDMSLSVKHCSNAYMLVYIRVSEIPRILETVTESEIPSELNEKVIEEKRMEAIRRRERSEANSYVFVHVILEEYFVSNQSTDLYDIEKIQPRIFKFKKTQTVAELMQLFVESFKVEASRMRIWSLVNQAQLTRPVYFDCQQEAQRPLGKIISFNSFSCPWAIYLEMRLPDEIGSLPPFVKNRDILLFFKFYDPTNKILNYLGSRQCQLQMKLADVIPDLCRQLDLPPTTDLSIYEEQGPNVVQKILNLQDTLEKSLKINGRDDIHGIVLIFEMKHFDEKLELPTCDDYFRDLLYRVEVTFVEKSTPNDAGFTLELSQRNNYDQIAQAVGQKINTDPFKIQFFKCQGYQPGSSVMCNFDGCLKDLLANNKPRTVKKLFYQHLSMNINELENKKQFKCVWVSSNLKNEKELVLYPNKNGTVKNLLDEARKQIEFNDITHKLRLIEISGYKILSMVKEETLLDTLQGVSADTSTNQTVNQKFYRVDEFALDEINLNENEMLIPISHFSTEIYNSFGVPFFIKIRQNEQFSCIKIRMQKKLAISEKEWDKYKFAIISMGRVDYISDDSLINLNDFKLETNQIDISPPPYLGIDHINKSQKRSRLTYLEKAIKIYN